MNLPRWRNSFAFLLLLVLLVPILAACGGTAATPQATTAPAAEATTGAAAETATEAPAADATEATTDDEGTTDATATADAGTEDTEATPEATEGAAGGAAAGDTGELSPAGNVLRLNFNADPDTIDPQVASFVSSITFIMLNYLPLMTFDTDLQPVPGAAESYEMSEDGTTFTFRLRPGQTYSDGEPLTAENFEYAWKRWCDPAVAGEYTSLAFPVVGCEEYYTAFESGSVTVTDEAQLQTLRDGVGVEALDENTLEIRLDEPAPYFLNIMALWGGVPTREDGVEAGGEQWWADPANYIGNGPFQLVEWEQGSRSSWERNENYVLDQPQFEGIEAVAINESNVSFEAYRAGELDIINVAAEDIGTVEGDPDLAAQRVDVGGTCTFGVHMNVSRPPFDNREVRQAFAQATDREGFVRDVLNDIGAPAQSFIPPGIPGHDPDETLWELDAAAARQKLEATGVDLNQEIKYSFSASARNQARAEYIAAMYQNNLGVKITLDPIDPTQYQSLFSAPETTPQMYLLGWCMDYPDPQNWTSLVWSTGGITAGDLGYSNPELDRLTQQADALPVDDPQRLELHKQAQHLLVEDAPQAFLWYQSVPQLHQPWVTGVQNVPGEYIPGFFAIHEIQIAHEE